MTFGLTTVWFIAFLAMSLLVYYIIPKKIQWMWLTVVSFVFIYLCVGFAAFPVLLLDIAATWLGALLIDRSQKTGGRRLWLIVSLLIIVGQLFLFKYYNNLVGWVGLKIMHTQFPVFSSALLAPVGISYFSLSAVGYLLDVYWKSRSAEKNPARIALLVTWFPALVSGPIVKFGELSQELFAQHRFSYTGLKFGFERMLWGFFKKLVIADRLALATSQIFSSSQIFDGLYIVLAVVMFGFQIYTDFSGCMDIILGASEMFGIKLPENFRQPFFSRNLSEFWRRWHITLGVWAKEYVMYPLLKTDAFQRLGGLMKKKLGKRVGKNIPTYIAMLIVWLIIGVWHGAMPAYILASGIIPWITIVVGQFLQPLFDRMTKALKIKTESLGYRIFAALRTAFAMCAVWLFATATSISGRISGILHPSAFDINLVKGIKFSRYDLLIVFISLVAVFLVDLWKEKGVNVRESLENKHFLLQWVVLLVLMFSSLIFGVYDGFSSGTFIYGGF